MSLRRKFQVNNLSNKSHATLCDHVSGLSGKVVTNSQCWVALEPNHSSVATFSNLKAGKKHKYVYVHNCVSQEVLVYNVTYLGGNSRKAINCGGVGESLTRDWM